MTSSHEDAVYRPVSGLAVSGLALAVVFAVWVLVAALFAFRSGLPLLINPAVLLLPLIAASLCLVARGQIRRAEGTRVGLRVAHGGLLLAALFGLGYGAYRGAIELALRQQASDFATAWMGLVARSGNDEVDALTAFWNTLDPGRRDQSLDLNQADVRQQVRSKPENIQALRESLRRRYWFGERGRIGILPAFGDHDLVHLIRQWGDRATIEPVGVRQWEHRPGAEGGYLVEQTCRVTTPEGTFEVVLALLGRDGERRQWQVRLGECHIKRPGKLTPLGTVIGDLRQDSRRFAGDWAGRVLKGESADTYFDTLAPDERRRLRSEVDERLLLAALSLGAPGLLGVAPLTDGATARACFLPGYAEYVGGRRLVTTGLAVHPEIAAVVAREAPALFRGGTPGFVFRVGDSSMAPSSPWEMAGGELRFRQPFELSLEGKFRCEGDVIVATNDAGALARVKQAEAGEAPGVARPVSWRIIALEPKFGAIVAGQ